MVKSNVAVIAILVFFRHTPELKAYAVHPSFIDKKPNLTGV